MAPTDLVAHSDGLTLTGSLWLPRGRPRAVVVMHPGSGPSDRGNDDLFGEVRPLFLDRAVAVASFDKRGVGGSGGDWRDAAIDDQARDLLAGVRAARAAVPDGPAGVYGHSQGGWVAVEAAARAGNDLAFAVSSSGPAVPPMDQERYALDRALEGLAPQLADRVREVFVAVVDGLRTAADVEEADAHLRSVADAAALDWFDRNAWHPADAHEWELSRRLAAYDPAPALAGIAVPLLVLYGGDERVVPVEECTRVLRRLVRPDLLDLVVVPGGDHRLRAGDPASLVPEVAPAVHAFLDRVLLPAG